MASLTEPRNRARIKEARGDRVFTVINAAILVIFTLSVLYPILYVVSSSFSSADAVMAGRVVVYPVEFTLDGYKAVFNYPRIWVGFMNSLFYAVVGTTVNVIMTLIAAYPLSRRDLFGRTAFLSLFLFTMLFSGGLIPTYLLVRQLGLLNTRWALIFPQSLSVWNLLITIAFFRTSIPPEMLEAAQLDGANDLQHFIRIVLPLSSSIIAVIGLFYAVSHWNQFFSALLYLGRAEMHPLQLVLREILVQNQVDMAMLGDVREMARRQGVVELLKFSSIVVASVPVLLAYPFVQRHFVKGIMLGAVKG
jgi:multiple sugar transport system permease protein/putative aldouronate transport system permease protein